MKCEVLKSGLTVILAASARHAEHSGLTPIGFYENRSGNVALCVTPICCVSESTIWVWARLAPVNGFLGEVRFIAKEGALRLRSYAASAMAGNRMAAKVRFGETALRRSLA